MLFSKCNGLETILIPDSVTSIGNKAFYNCENLTTVTMSKSLVSIYGEAFGDCISLSTIDCIPKTLESAYGNGWNDDIGPFSGCKRLKTVTFESGMTSIPGILFSKCTGIETITIPNTVTSIGPKSFYSCENLKIVNMSKSLVSIFGEAFGDCKRLTTIDIVPKTLENAYGNGWNDDIGPFSGCESLKTVTIETGITAIPRVLFSMCTGLETITIPNTVTTIFSKSFYNCEKLKTVNMSRSLVYIYGEAFGNCKSLETIEIPRSLEKVFGSGWSDNIGPFTGCENLKNVTFEKGISKIIPVLFSGCSGLKTITIPENYTSIGDYAFYNCTGLKNIVIPNSIETLGTSVFSGCTSLESAVLPETIQSLPENIFSGCTSLNNIIIPDTIKTIPENAFNACSALSNIEFPKELQSIKYNAFQNCIALKELYFPDSVEDIYQDAFNHCTSLTKVVFQKSIKTIGYGAFAQCENLENLVFPNEVNSTKIQGYSFSECAKLKNIKLPNGISEINSYAFQKCSSLTDISIPSSVKVIGSYAFLNCEVLENVLIADYSIKEVSDSTFKECLNLKKIILPKGLTKISDFAFANNTSLTEVEIPESVTTIATNAFSYPDIMTAYGYTESYAKQYCDEKGINFVDNHVLSQGIALDQTHCTGEDYIIMDIGETNEVKFDIYPLNSNDVISLASDNTRVTINGMHITSKYAGDSVITATATSGVEYTFTIHSRSVKNVSVKTIPENLKVTQGNELDLTGFELQVNYNDNSNAVTDNYTISGFDKDTIGVQTITVLYVGANGSTYKTTFNVEVVDPRGNLTGISIKQYPQKLKYVKYDALDLSGLIVVENYDSGLEIEITDYKATGYNALKLGKQTITIAKGEYNTNFTVEVFSSLEPTEPTEPTNPTETTEPTNPTEPVNPTAPTDPTIQTDPSEPTDPTEPIEPTNPTNPEKQCISSLQISLEGFEFYDDNYLDDVLGNSRIKLIVNGDKTNECHNDGTGTFVNDSFKIKSTRYTVEEVESEWNSEPDLNVTIFFDESDYDWQTENYVTFTLEYIGKPMPYYESSIKFIKKPDNISDEPVDHMEGAELLVKFDSPEMGISVERKLVFGSDFEKKTYEDFDGYNALYSFTGYDEGDYIIEINNGGTDYFQMLVLLRTEQGEYVVNDSDYGFFNKKTYISATEEDDVLIGDANGDGVVNITDATTVQKHIAQLIELEGDCLKAADANGDGTVNIADATQIQKYIAQLIDHLG